MSRTFGRHACGRGCIVCAYTPARNLRAANDPRDIDAEIEECFDNMVIYRDGSSRLDYAYDREVLDVESARNHSPLVVPLWQIARVA